MTLEDAEERNEQDDVLAEVDGLAVIVDEALLFTLGSDFTITLAPDGTFRIDTPEATPRGVGFCARPR